MERQRSRNKKRHERKRETGALTGETEVKVGVRRCQVRLGWRMWLWEDGSLSGLEPGRAVYSLYGAGLRTRLPVMRPAADWS